jgi:type I restriction enzyme S subunit
MEQDTTGHLPEGWETERLGNLTEDSAYGVNASAEEFDPEKPRYLRITDIADDGHLKQDDPKSISWDVSEGYELEPGDIVFARTGATVGKTLLYQEDHPESAYAGYLIRFQLDQTRILPKFVFYFTQTNNYDRWVSRITRQGAQENINTGEYCSILLPLPPIAEQQKIVSILETVDQNIEQERKTKKSFQELKRGLMQDLLTGKVRVNTD